MSIQNSHPFFAPQLFVNNGVKDISFYERAFKAELLRLFFNDDGSIHVAELAIDGAMFHLHETTPKSHFFSPDKHRGTTTLIGLFVPDVDAVMLDAINAGATEINPAKDYEYGFRQGEIKDPFGHCRLIQKRI